MSEHSPTPWRADHSGNIYDANNVLVVCDGGLDDADADLIVSAVNERAEMASQQAAFFATLAKPVASSASGMAWARGVIDKALNICRWPECCGDPDEREFCDGCPHVAAPREGSDGPATD